MLVDGGCRVHGYSSDVTRTGVFGAPPTDRQRRIWDLVRKAQKSAFDAKWSGTRSSRRWCESEIATGGYPDG